MVIFHSYVKLPEGIAGKFLAETHMGASWIVTENDGKDLRVSIERAPQ